MRDLMASTPSLLSTHDRIAIGVLFTLCLIAIIGLVYAFVRTRKNYLALQQKHTHLSNRFSLRESFINASDDLIYLKDPELRYLFLNDALAKHIDMDRKDLIGVDDFAITDTARAEWRRETDLEVLNGKERIRRTVRYGGDVYSINKFPVLFSRGEVGVGAIIKDITEEERLRSENLKIEKRQKRLLDIVQETEATGRVPYRMLLEGAVELTESLSGFMLMRHQKDYVHVASLGCVKPENCKRLFAVMMEDNTAKTLLFEDKELIFDNRSDLQADTCDVNRYLAMSVDVENHPYAIIVVANKPEDYTDADQRQLMLLVRGAAGTIERERMLATFARQRAYAYTTFDQVRDGIVSIRANQTLGYLNRSAEKALGLVKKDVIGKPWHDTLKLEPKDDIDAFFDDPTPDWQLSGTLNPDNQSIKWTAHAVHDGDNFVGVTLILKP